MSTQNEHLAHLLTQQQSANQETDAEFAARFGKNWRTYFNWRTGANAPTGRDHATIETGIGWKIGSIGRLLSGEGAFLTLADVQDVPVAERPVKRAADLSDDELAMEMMRRFKTYADQAHKPATATTPAQDRWEDFGLAASNTPGAKRFKDPEN